MDPLTTAAASGLQARMDSMDMLANNLSNSSSSGYKTDREFYGTYLSPELASAASPIVGESPVVQKRWTDLPKARWWARAIKQMLLSQDPGFSALTDQTDLYIPGTGTSTSSQGVLVTNENYAVRLTGDKTLQVQTADPLTIDRNGIVTQAGAQLGQLELSDFQEPNALIKVGATNFTTEDPQAKPDKASTAEVYQATAETSNAAPSEAAARMISVLRNFEMLQHAIKIGTEMNRQAVEEVARITS